MAAAGGTSESTSPMGHVRQKEQPQGRHRHDEEDRLVFHDTRLIWSCSREQVSSRSCPDGTHAVASEPVRRRWGLGWRRGPEWLRIGESGAAVVGEVPGRISLPGERVGRDDGGAATGSRGEAPPHHAVLL